MLARSVLATMIRKFRAHIIVVFFALAAVACYSDDNQPTNPGNGGTIPEGFELDLLEVASGIPNPLLLTAPAGDDRLFVVQQSGMIRIVSGGDLLATPFLDIRTKVQSGGERGLLGLAFHPDYSSNGYFYVNYSGLDGDTRVERYSVSTGDPNVANAASASLVIEIAQPYSNHNGGMILFAPDGMLLVGMGDGGSGGDPLGHGQNRATLLGSMLRLDVNVVPYAIPQDNPYATHPAFRPEIWAYGLRNPWRFSVDATTGHIYTADVGQSTQEEVNVAPVTAAALNYGWNITEGTNCFNATSCNRSGLTEPVLVYGRQSGCSVTGGYVYRGAAMEEIRGHYFYSDYCQGWLRSFRYENGAATEQRDWNIGDIGSVLSFGEDGNRELYILTDQGRIYRLVEAS